MRLLVTGGVRSGKSVHAERLMADEPVVRYVAAGPAYDDADWLDRIERHRARRPGHWETVETSDLAAALSDAPGAVIVDCLGTWLTSVLDEASLWEAGVDEMNRCVVGRLDPVLGAVPEHRSGRVFRDLLGTVNQQVGAVVDSVHLVVAGRVLELA